MTTPVGTIIAFAGPIEAGSDLYSAHDPGGLPASQRRLHDAGWLLCDGRPVYRSVYPALYNIIGYAFGGSDNTFNLPDLRGRFLRGVNLGATVSATDPTPRVPDESDRVSLNPKGQPGDVGSLQTDAIQGHEHVFYYASMTVAGAPGEGAVSVAQMPPAPDLATLTGTPPTFPPTPPVGPGIGPTSTITGKPNAVRVSTETRPVNIYVNFLIQYR